MQNVGYLCITSAYCTALFYKNNLGMNFLILFLNAINIMSSLFDMLIK